MKLEEILKNPVAFLRYAERYINLGSPSGFGSINEVSEAYQPQHESESFLVPIIPHPDMQIIGSAEDIGITGIPTHPDMAQAEPAEYIRVTPTSSSRTVLTFGEKPYFIKLHFSKKIGRAPRNIRKKDVERSIYANNLLKSAQNLEFGFLPEPVGVFSEKLGYGAIYRTMDACPKRENNLLMPIFSLFAPDSRKAKDRMLITQLLDANPQNYNLLIEALSGFYINASIGHNFLFESQAQNLMLQLKSDLSIDRVVVRDFFDFYIDNDNERVMRNLSVFEGEEKKCYRSFIFDFKLGNYVLKPLENALKENGFPKFRKDFVGALYDKLSEVCLEDKFKESLPKGAYGYANTLNIIINHKPQLVPMGKPRYR
jgi:hypothetical protein